MTHMGTLNPTYTQSPCDPNSTYTHARGDPNPTYTHTRGTLTQPIPRVRATPTQPIPTAGYPEPICQPTTNLCTHPFPIPFLATCCVKFWIISFVGRRPLSISPMIYLASSSSCWGLSNCRSTAYSLIERWTPLCLLDSVHLLTPYLSAISWYINFSPSPMFSIAASVSYLAPILVVLCRSEGGHNRVVLCMSAILQKNAVDSSNLHLCFYYPFNGPSSPCLE
jgi:hypothetical protein